MSQIQKENRRLIMLFLVPLIAYLSTRPVLLFVSSWQEWLFADYFFRVLLLVYVIAIPSVRSEIIKMFCRSWPEIYGAKKALIFFWVICGFLLLEWIIDLHVREPIYHIFPESALFTYFQIESSFWLTFDLIVGLVLVALSEEILLRGVLHRIVEHITLNPILIVAVSAVIFGLMHWPSGLHNIGAATLSGVLFSTLYLWSKSLIPGVVIHYLVNLAHFWPS